MDDNTEESFDESKDNLLKRKRNKDDETKIKKLKFSPRNPNKISKAELFKPPTTEELNRLRETELLFNSNLFRLQTEEFLNEITVKPKMKGKIAMWINNFKLHMNAMEELQEINISKFDVVLGETNNDKLRGKFKNILKYYPNDLKTDQDAKFIFLKPKEVNIVGLYNVNGCCEPNVNITFNVQMQKAHFKKTDYLNARYLVKRALYLSYVASHLANCKVVESVSYTFLNGNHLIPIIQIMPKLLKRVAIQVLVTIEDVFKLSRFSPDSNNIRTSYFDTNEIDQTSCEIPTPFYNAAILHDLTLEQNNLFKHSKLKGLKSISDGIILLTTWLRQRELSFGFGSFTDDLMYSYVVYLLNIGRINKYMSSYQVIRNVWTNLANTSWDSNGIILSEENVNMSAFHEKYDMVFIDVTGFYNLAANLNKNIYHQVKLQSALAIKYLDEGKFDCFEALFIKKMPFYLQHDVLINIHEDPTMEQIYGNVEFNKKLDYLHFKYPLIMDQVLKLLEEALNDRAICIMPSGKIEKCWEIGTKPEDKLIFSIGITLNPENLFKTVDKGPQAYEPLAKKFREFWSEKADLRRFKDGTICEAVYWSAETIQDKRVICKEIISFIFESKLNLNNFNVIIDQFDYVLRFYKFPAIEEANVKIINLFDDLGKKIRALTLPLNIASIQGVSDAFSYVDAYPAVPMNYKGGGKITHETNNVIYLKENTDLGMVPKYVAPIEGVITMGLHSKWPNDTQAIDHIKTAFYIQICDQLKKMFFIKSNAKRECLDVLYNGLVFRFVIFHPKQITLSKKAVNEKGLVLYRDTKESLLLEQKYVFLPKLIGALGGLHSQFPSYGPSTIIIKRWLNSQMIDESHVPNIVISLLNASLYINNVPFIQPALPQVAFFRFLKMLTTFDFNAQPVILNFNNDLTKEQLDGIEAKFHQERSSYPHVFIITPFDDLKSAFTQDSPSKEIFHRISMLAKECVNVVEQNIYSSTLINVKSFFKTNLTGYNVIIHLKPLLNPRRFQDLLKMENAKYVINYEEHNNDCLPIVDFDPVALYLRDLRRHYSDFALFFHDNYGGCEIAVLWKPTIFQLEDFKVSNVEGKKLHEDKLKVDIDTIIEDFYILGSGVVKSIENNS